jgi:hypothetical protein
MGIRARRATRQTSLYRAARDRLADLLGLAQVWVQAIPRLAHAFRFIAGALMLIVVKGIRRTLGQSGSLR